MQNITIKFGGLIAVNSVNFEVEKNSIYGLIGPNGAGKTTVFNIISGVYKPTEGEILFNGQRIDGLKPYQINQKGIARTYQNINLFKNMTVLENIMVGSHSRSKNGLLSAILKTRTQKIEEEKVRLKSFELLDFVGLVGKSDQLAKNLSYGEQRLVEIARSLASEPEMLLLDEPAAGMNSTEKVELTKLIRKIQAKGITILIVEHDMKLVMGITNHITVLNYGKKVVSGEPKLVQNHPDVIEAYLGGSE